MKFRFEIVPFNSPLDAFQINSRFQPLSPSIRAVCCVVVLFLGIAMGSAVVDDFNDGNDDGWTRYDPISQHPSFDAIGTFSFPSNNSYRIQSEPSPAPALPPNGVGPGRVGALRADANFTDFYISVDIIDWDPTLNQVFGITARLDDVGLGQTDGYAFTYDAGGGDLDLTAFLNEDPTNGGIPAGGNETANLVPGRHYRMIFCAVGQQLTGTIYELPDLENPIAQLIGMDNRYPSGSIGLINYDNSGDGRTDVTYDNFVALAAPPPRLTYALAPNTGDVILFWPSVSRSFILQATSDFSPNGWTNIPPPYEVLNDSFYHLEPSPIAAQHYFRLISE